MLGNLGVGIDVILVARMDYLVLIVVVYCHAEVASMLAN